MFQRQLSTNGNQRVIQQVARGVGTASIIPMLAVTITMLLVGLRAGTQAQSGSLSMTERLRLKAPLEEIERRAMFRSADATDRAVAELDLSRLSVWTYNFGLTIGRIYSAGRANFPCADGTQRSFYFVSSPAFAVEAGPWHPNSMVHEASDYHSLSKIDWEARDDARGEHFSSLPRLGGSQLMAMSDMSGTWPEAGWPAPENVIEVWLGTETWPKWERRMQRETYGIFDDAYADREGRGDSIPLGIEVQFRGLTSRDDDIVYFQYEFRNNSSHHLTGVYLGQIVDSGSPTTHDYADAFLRYDPELQLIYAVGSNYDPEAGTHTGRAVYPDNAGWVGTIWLDTPTGSFKEEEFRYVWPPYAENPSEILTRVALLNWDDRVLSSEPSLYGAMSGDISHMEPIEADWIWKTGQNGGLPVLKQTEDDYIAYYTDWQSETDLFYYASSGPVDMPPGSILNYVFAIVGGDTEGEMRAEAERAIQVFNDQFRAPSQPEAPRLRANGFRAGPHGREYDERIHRYPIIYAPSGEVTLSWNGQIIESLFDAATDTLDFEGYRVYRSSDRGATWGTPIHDPEGQRISWVPVAQFDLSNGIRGLDPLSYRHLGDDTGLQRTWTDTTALDGIEYWYTVTSYDRGVTINGEWLFSSLESPMPSDPDAPSMVAVITGPRPPGFLPGGIGDGVESSWFHVLMPAADERSTSIGVRVVEEETLTGDDYQIAVYDHYEKIIPNYYGSLDHVASFERGGLDVLQPPPSQWRTPFPQRCDSPGQGHGSTDILDGFRVEVSQPNNANGGISSFAPTTDVGSGAGFTVWLTEATYAREGDEANRANLSGFMNDLELRFTGFATGVGDSNLAHDALTRGQVTVPFELWDTDRDLRLYPVILDSASVGPPHDQDSIAGQWDGRDHIFVTTEPYLTSSGGVVDFSALHPATADTYWVENPVLSTSRSDWIYRLAFFESDSSHTRWDIGDVWTVRPWRPLKYHTGQTFTFTTVLPADQAAENAVEAVTVVPNPYYVFAAWDQSEYERKIQFRNVPADATIRIYTLAGELVAILDHRGDATAAAGNRGYYSNRIGTVDWNLWSYEFMEVSYGLYLYIVETDDGRQKVGKFAIVR
ncbi:hypothetical protein ACFL6R_02105 [Gemmatimonadota bacterium]